jgi:anti-anti-sigma regulatory factor
MQVRMLSELADGLRRRRLRFVISNPSERVFAMLERSGLLDTIGALVGC